MTLSGQLKDYSLPELLKTLEQGNKTGTLTIRIFDRNLNTFIKADISINDGYVVAFSKDLTDRDLLELMYKRRFLDQPTVESIMQMNDEFKLNTPLGVYLQTQGKINSVSLKIAFDLQVVNKITKLFEIPDAWFTFNPRLRASMLVQTGLKIKSAELNLLGLRDLQNWDHLSDKLPEGSFALIKRPPSTLNASLNGQPKHSTDLSTHLNPIEHEVLQCSDGTMDLNKMASSLNLSIKEVQKISFRLIAAGLVEELPMVSARPSTLGLKSVPNPACAVNSSFLANLNGFLKNKSMNQAKASA